MTASVGADAAGARGLKKRGQHLVLESPQAADGGIDDDRIAAVRREQTHEHVHAPALGQLAGRRGHLAPHRPHRIRVASLMTEAARALVGSFSHRSDNRTPAARTSADRSASAFSTTAGVNASVPGQRPQRVELRAPVRRRSRERFERRADRCVTTLDQQALRRVAPPAVRMRQRRHELLRRGLRQRGLRAASVGPGTVDDAPDAPVAHRHQ